MHWLNRLPGGLGGRFLERQYLQTNFNSVLHPVCSFLERKEPKEHGTVVCCRLSVEKTTYNWQQKTDHASGKSSNNQIIHQPICSQTQHWTFCI